ncbi:hypothetical protein COBT_003344 [Conglomerata obtusa]
MCELQFMNIIMTYLLLIDYTLAMCSFNNPKELILHEVLPIFFIYNQLKVFDGKTDYKTANDNDVVKQSGLELIELNNEYTIWKSPIRQAFYFVVHFKFTMNHDWEQNLQNVKHINILKHFERNTLKNTLKNIDKRLGFTETESIIQPLSASSLCDPNDHLYIKNVIKDYDPTINENKLTILKNIMRDLLHAIECLQENFIVHCRIRPCCIMVCKEDGNVFYKLGFFHDSIKIKKKNCTLSCHSIFCLDVDQSTCEMQLVGDIWGLGLTCLVLYLGYDFIAGSTMFNQEFDQLKLNSTAYINTKGIKGDFATFIIGCLQVDPVKRASARDLLSHQFLN